MLKVYLGRMISITRTSGFILLLFVGLLVNAQQKENKPGELSIKVITETATPVIGATVELVKNKQLVKATITNKDGTVVLPVTDTAAFSLIISYTGYQSQQKAVTLSANNMVITLLPISATLAEVNITNKKKFIEQSKGKTVLNVDAAITNTGTTVLEVLEKSPGVTVDRNGGISLQGKAGVLVLIDDKQTYLSGADLNNLLSGMSSAQVETIELMTNPPARFDASGNAGIINIKTKQRKTKGFNGSLNIAAGQGIYPKNTNGLVLNYRTAKFNSFLTYSMNLNKNYTNLYAYRKYFDDNGNVTAVLDQPTYFRGSAFNNTLKTGIDYYLTPKTTVGLVAGGTINRRSGGNTATATWLNPAGIKDSAVATASNTLNKFRNASVNVNLSHAINKMQDLAMDFDWLKYSIKSQQSFSNNLQSPGGYSEATRGDIPSSISIFSGKIDYNLHTTKATVLQSGFKTSYISTDNIASYQNYTGTTWQEDYGKSNHFIYKENIYAAYASVETKVNAFVLNGGMRYEYTHYNANQLGNAQQKDSAFSRNYGALFPTATLSWHADSNNSFTATAGRRLDRPAFQKLNPFVFILNKYTYQTGNPFIVPQYSTSFELTHSWKSIVTTTASYSRIKNYFSQLFLTDPVTGILLYSEGNVGATTVLGLSSTLVVSPAGWWSVTLQANYNHKRLKGYNGTNYSSNINQLNINCNNQFTFAGDYTAEISGFYTTKARNDLQELLYPTGQLSLGVAKPVLKKKGTLKLSLRDVFYTNAMEGLTQFAKATEYFILRRDSRVLNLAFTYRFGKSFKSIKKSGSAAEEMERVGSG